MLLTDCIHTIIESTNPLERIMLMKQRWLARWPPWVLWYSNHLSKNHRSFLVDVELEYQQGLSHIVLFKEKHRPKGNLSLKPLQDGYNWGPKYICIRKYYTSFYVSVKITEVIYANNNRCQHPCVLKTTAVENAAEKIIGCLGQKKNLVSGHRSGSQSVRCLFLPCFFSNREIRDTLYTRGPNFPLYKVWWVREASHIEQTFIPRCGKLV